MNLSNEVIFITGATSGFGEAIARKFANSGAKLVLTGRRMDRLITLQNELGGDNIHIANLDVRDYNTIAKLLAELPERFQKITVLINNAGLALGLEQAQNCSIEDWNQMIDTNIKGLTYCTHLILPEMAKQNHGYIINIGSIAGIYTYPGSNVYGATKAFVHQFSLNLRADLLGTALRVTTIAPGMANTEFSSVRFHGNKAKADDVYSGMKPISAEDIAETVFWCVSRPTHLNINQIELMPISQASGSMAVYRSKK